MMELRIIVGVREEASIVEEYEPMRISFRTLTLSARRFAPCPVSPCLV